MTNNTFNQDTVAGRRVGLSLKAVVPAVVALTCAMVSPARAEWVDRVYKSCVATAEAGNNFGECSIYIPPGKRFVILSATARGSLPSAQTVSVKLYTTPPGAPNRIHFFQPGFQVLSNTWSEWTGSIPGTIWSDAGTTIMFRVVRGPSTAGQASFWLGLSGYWE